MPRLRHAARTAVLGALLALSTAPAIASPDRAARFYDDAAARFERNDVAGAIVQLKNALQQDPKLLAAQILLGRAYLAQGDAAAAEDAFAKALQLGVSRAEVAVPMAKALLDQGNHRAVLERFPPESAPPERRAELLLIRAQAFQGAGDLDAAQKAFAEARAADRGSVAPVLALAELAARHGRRADAEKLAAEALALAPESAPVWHFRGSLVLAAGDAKSALDAFGRALALDPGHLEARVARAAVLMDFGRMDEAGRDIDHLAATSPREPRALYVRALYLAKRGDERGVREALVGLTNAIDQVPRSVLKQRAPDLLMLAGLGHQGLRQWEKARQYLDDYLSVRPNDIGTRRLLASIMLGQRDYRGAISMLEPARRLAPNDPQVLALLATAHMGIGQHTLAGNYLDQALKESGGSADVHSTLGLNLLGRGQSDLALQHLQQAFKKDPGQIRSGVALAALYVRRGQPQQAVAVADAIVKREPQNAYAWNLLGVARVATGDRKGARAAYERAVAVRPTFAPAVLNLGRLDVAEGNPAAARARLEGLLKREPSNAQAMYELALAEEAAGRNAEAIRWLEKAQALQRRNAAVATRLVDLHLAARAPDKALEVAKDVTAALPENLDALAALGRVYLVLGDAKQAQTLFARMSRLAAFNPAWQTRIARLQLQAGNPEGASQSLEKALSAAPDYLPAQVLLAEMDLRGGALGKAEQRAKAIVQRAPEQATGYQLLGELALARRNYPEAVERYRAALAKEPSTDGALRLFAAHIQAGNAVAANQFLESWVHSHPNDRRAKQALAEGYLHAGNLPAARAWYERILQEQGEDETLLNNLANVLLAQGDAKALEYAQRAHRLAPSDPAVGDTLGWILVQQGQVEQGIRHLRDARLRDPGSPEIRYHLAEALARAGRKDEARRELEPAVKGGVEFSSKASAVALWRSLGAQ